MKTLDQDIAHVTFFGWMQSLPWPVSDFAVEWCGL
jgi:hypothetical protein